MPDLRVSAMKKSEIWPFWRMRSEVKFGLNKSETQS